MESSVSVSSSDNGPMVLLEDLVSADVVLDEDDDADISRLCLAGAGIAYGVMRLPDKGVYFGAQVTQVDLPNLVRENDLN